MLTFFVRNAYRERPWPIAWTLLIACYLFVEWAYNQHLMQLLHYPEVTAQQFEWTERFGKAIASIGLNLVLIKCFKRPGVFKFFVGVVLAYGALTWLFDKAIASFPDEFRHSSYYGVLHRTDVVQGKDKDRILAFANNEPWYVRSLVLSQHYLTLQDKEWVQVEQEMRRPLDKKTKALVRDKAKLWGQYEKSEDARQVIEARWKDYEGAMLRLKLYPKETRDGAMARTMFVSKVGVPPDMTYMQFVRYVAKPYHDYLTTVFVEGNPAVNVAPIRGQDIPLRMNQAAFYKYLDDTAHGLQVALAPTVHDIRGNTASKDAVALLVIPPLSIGLSLVSIALNIVALVCAWTMALVPGTVRMRRGACALVCTVAFVGLAFTYTNAEHPLRGDTYWATLDTQLEQNHPMVWAAMSIPMKLEPLLCATDEPVQWIQRSMQTLYKIRLG